jgi:hypothetical protein
MPPSKPTPPSPERLLINAVYDIISCIWQIYVQLLLVPPALRVIGLVIVTREFVLVMLPFMGSSGH